MNTPNRPHEELDADERELARVVRALPGNEPPAALDLRILRAAQDAVTMPGKRTRRALWAANSAGSFWGFGTAAAAVLAVGISWQMFMRAPSGNLPTSGPAIVAKDSAADDEATSVDFVSVAPPTYEGGAADQLASAPANQPMLERQRANAAAEPKRDEGKMMSPPLPEPFADEHVAETDASGLRAQSRIGTIDQNSSDRRADMAAKSAIAESAPAESAASAASAAAAPAIVMAPAPMQKPAAPPATDAPRREQLSLEKTEAANAAADVGQLAGAAAAAPMGEAEMQAKQAAEESPETARHRVRLDARLYPESWVLKIRSRLRHGDVAGARASLKLFVEHYPHETVPTNLKPLLGE